MKIRKRALPPGWYPATARECEREIRAMIGGFSPPKGRWLAGVIPHAGWYFSGRLAARVMHALAASVSPEVAVVFGGHLSSGEKPVIYMEEAWETPFGPQVLDRSLVEELAKRTGAVKAGPSFADNTVEIQLPLVKWFFPEAELVAAHAPSSAGAGSLAQALCDILDERRRPAVFLGSADLTHYGPDYGFVPQGTGTKAVEWVTKINDTSLIEKVLIMDTAGVLEDATTRQNTCSAGPIVSAITCAARRGASKGVLLEYATSRDIRPDVNFVGYAAILF